MQSVFAPVPAETEHVATGVIGAAIEVHRHLGPGFLEKIYQEALCLELHARDLAYERERAVVVHYRGIAIPGQRIDLIVGGLRARGTESGRTNRCRSRSKDDFVSANDRPSARAASELQWPHDQTGPQAHSRLTSPLRAPLRACFVNLFVFLCALLKKIFVSFVAIVFVALGASLDIRLQLMFSA
jgi:hypothetical protein